MADVQIESDPLFQLLTDALRAGPQSAEWVQAVERVREAGAAAEADEYQMLLRAREDLESGKEYKSVRAGAGFTRNLFGKIDEEKEAVKAKGLPTANLLALLAGVVILGVIAVVAFLLSRGDGNGTTAGETLPALFPTTLASTAFAPGDKGFTLTGNTETGLHPGGAAVVEQPITGRFEIEADVQSPPGAPETALVQIIVPGGLEPSKVPENGSPRWQLYGSSQRVLVGDSTKKIAPVPADGKITVRVVVGKSIVAVYSNKELLWSGPHGLPEGPKSPSVSILPAKAGATAVPTVTAIRIRGESRP